MSISLLTMRVGAATQTIILILNYASARNNEDYQLEVDGDYVFRDDGEIHILRSNDNERSQDHEDPLYHDIFFNNPFLQHKTPKHTRSKLKKRSEIDFDQDNDIYTLHIPIKLLTRQKVEQRIKTKKAEARTDDSILQSIEKFNNLLKEVPDDSNRATSITNTTFADITDNIADSPNLSNVIASPTSSQKFSGTLKYNLNNNTDDEYYSSEEYSSEGERGSQNHSSEYTDEQIFPPIAIPTPLASYSLGAPLSYSAKFNTSSPFFPSNSMYPSDYHRPSSNSYPYDARPPYSQIDFGYYFPAHYSSTSAPYTYTPEPYYPSSEPYAPYTQKPPLPPNPPVPPYHSNYSLSFLNPAKKLDLDAIYWKQHYYKNRGDCEVGTFWSMNCYECQCQKNGKAVCVRKNQCLPPPIDTPKLCKPYSKFTLEFNNCIQCTCSGDGLPECTFDYHKCSKTTGKEFYNKETTSEVEIYDHNNHYHKKNTAHKYLSPAGATSILDLNLKKCAAWTSWTAKCHDCKCDYLGQPLCTRIAFCIPKPYGIPPSCKPGTTPIVKGCVNCLCGDDGEYTCKFCQPDTMDD